MSRYYVYLLPSLRKKLDDFMTTVPISRTYFVSAAVLSAIGYYKRHQHMPTPDAEFDGLCGDADRLAANAIDLPGLSRDVILSHLVRFPKVSGDAYASIIEILRVRQHSSDGLKNPEAAAYGLCKQLQYGKTSKQTSTLNAKATPVIPPEASLPYNLSQPRNE